MSSSRNICSPVITSFNSRSFSSMLPFADAAAATSDAAILATLRSGILSDTMFSLHVRENSNETGRTKSIGIETFEASNWKRKNEILKSLKHSIIMITKTNFNRAFINNRPDYGDCLPEIYLLHCTNVIKSNRIPSLD